MTSQVYHNKVGQAHKTGLTKKNFRDMIVDIIPQLRKKPFILRNIANMIGANESLIDSEDVHGSLIKMRDALYPQKKLDYGSIYQAVKRSDGLLSRFKVTNLAKKGLVRANIEEDKNGKITKSEIALQDIDFFVQLAKAFGELEKTGLIRQEVVREGKVSYKYVNLHDDQSYKTRTEHQAQILFDILQGFISKMDQDQKRKLLNSIG